MKTIQRVFYSWLLNLLNRANLVSHLFLYHVIACAYAQNLSNCCRHKYDQLISRFFIYNFGQVFIWCHSWLISTKFDQICFRFRSFILRICQNLEGTTYDKSIWRIFGGFLIFGPAIRWRHRRAWRRKGGITNAKEKKARGWGHKGLTSSQSILEHGYHAAQW